MTASANGETVSAIELFKQAINEQPASSAAHFLLGSEYAASGDISRAEQHISMALLLNPQWDVARYQLGLLQFSDARVAAALLTWQPLTQHADGSAIAHWIQGFTALAQDDFVQARTYFEAGLTLNVEHPAMSQDIQRVLQKMAAQFSPEVSKDESAAHVLLANYEQSGRTH